MPAKKQIKQRTSKSKLIKKNRIPRYVIWVVVLLVAAVGIAVVYQSLAATTVNGILSWNGNTNNYKATANVYGQRQVCLKTNVTTNRPNSYYQFIYQRYNNRSREWVTIHGPVSYRANQGNKWYCKEGLQTNGSTIRAQIKPTEPVEMRASYQLTHVIP